KEFPVTADRLADVPMLVNGQWTAGSAPRGGDVFNPSTGQAIARVPFATADDTARAIDAAHAALPDWSATPAVQRAQLLFRFRELLMRDFEKLAQLVTREHGKTL